MNAKSIEDMRAELEATEEYGIEADNYWWCAYMEGDVRFDNIHIAYKHYQREKQHEAMRALLKRLTQLRIKQLVEQAYGSDNILAIMELPAIQEEAKALLESTEG